MATEIVIQGWLNICLLFGGIILVVMFFTFYDFRRRCRGCGSRFSISIYQLEVYRTKERIFAWELKLRECMRCGNRMLVKKRIKGWDRQKGKSITINFLPMPVERVFNYAKFQMRRVWIRIF